MSDLHAAPAAELAIEEYDSELILEAALEDLLALDPVRLEYTPDALLARALSRFDVDGRRSFLRVVSEDKAAAILAEMHAEDAAEVLEAMREPRAVKMLEGFDPDDAADVIKELDEEDRERLLQKLEPETAEEISYLLSYDPRSAGGIMTTTVAKVHVDSSTEQAIQEIRRLREITEQIYYLYVVDSDNRLVGVVSMRDLLLAPPRSVLRDIMRTNIQGASLPEEDRETVAMRLSELNLTALPVVDAENRLLGIVTHDDVMDILTAAATEDIQKMVGAGPDEGIHDPITYSLQKRGPWLLVNLFTACLAASVIYFYQDKIHAVTILAVILPIIVNLGGNTGSQTLAVLIRSLALGEIQERDSLQICLREAAKGFLNSLLVALVSAVLAWFVTGQAMVVLVVVLAMILTMIFGGLFGALIPLLLKRFGLDPAQSSSIFLTGSTDLFGFFIALQLGSHLLHA